MPAGGRSVEQGRGAHVQPQDGELAELPRRGQDVRLHALAPAAHRAVLKALLERHGHRVADQPPHLRLLVLARPAPGQRAQRARQPAARDSYAAGAQAST